MPRGTVIHPEKAEAWQRVRLIDQTREESLITAGYRIQWLEDADDPKALLARIEVA